MSNPQYANRNLQSETVTFDRFLVNVDAAVSDAVMRDLATAHRDMPLRMGTVSSELSPVYTHMLFSMRAWLLKSQHVEKSIRATLIFPKTWWDHVKHDMLSSERSWAVWVAKRFAAPNYTMVVQEEVHETRVCPHNNTYFPEGKQHINYLLWRDDGDRLA